MEMDPSQLIPNTSNVISNATKVCPISTNICVEIWANTISNGETPATHDRCSRPSFLSWMKASPVSPNVEKWKFS